MLDCNSNPRILFSHNILGLICRIHRLHKKSWQILNFFEVIIAMKLPVDHASFLKLCISVVKLMKEGKRRPKKDLSYAAFVCFDD